MTKEFGGKTVVNGLNISVNEGEIYGFLGPNGAGKSTTISMVLGFIPPTKGEVRIFGKKLSEDYFEVKRRIGVIGEIQHFYGDMTGFEYLDFFAGVFGVKFKEHRIKELLEMVNLLQYQNLQLKAYSKGMQQKLALVRALLHDPDLLILDEPVSSLDPNGIKQVREIILSENKRGKTFFLSSHLLSEIEKICNRIGIINQGVLLAEDTMEEIKKNLNNGINLEIELEKKPVEETINVLKSLLFVENLIVQGSTIKIHISGREDCRSEISRILILQGNLIINMKASQMSLEEAFVTITEKNTLLLAGKG